MAYDAHLADRVRDVLDTLPGLDLDRRGEKRMFGGLAFLLDGHIAVACTSGGLMLRVEPAEQPALLTRPHVGPMEMRGKALAGWLLVASEGLEDGGELREWVERGVEQVPGE